NAAHQDLAEGESHSETFTVTVTDDHGATATQDVTVTVTGSNDKPTVSIDTNAASDTVAEGAANGTLVGITAYATDVDNGSVVTYSLTDSAGGRFAIDATTGVVSVANGTLLNYEAATSHNITVQASDGVGGTSTQTFSIAVSNVAPSTPTDSNAAAN